MIRHFIYKEVVESIGGPKFIITFLICAVLILISVFSGYQLYRTEADWQTSALSANQKTLRNLGSYGMLKIEGAKAIRPPSALSIFVRGADSAIGRAANVKDDVQMVLRDSRFGLNPIFSVFGELDLAFIVKIILALFALLFSYNAISGERELGTLKQVLSNSVGRASFILGKSIGGLLTLFITFLVPLLISLLMLLVLFNVSFSGDEWIRLGLLTLFFCVYLAVFYMIGMLMSALTRNSFVSFLLCLFVWVMSVAVVPRSAVEVAGWISPAPSIDEVEAERAALRRNYFADLKDRLTGYLTEILRNPPSAGQGQGQRGRDLAREARERAVSEAKATIAKQEKALLDDYENRQLRLLNTAGSLARISPTSCVTFAAGRLAATDAELKQRFIESLERYQKKFIEYADDKIKKNPMKSSTGVGTSISQDVDDEGIYSFSVNVRTPEFLLDVGDVPKFHMESEPLMSSVAATIPDFAILAVEFLAFFAAAFVAFLRYDVR